jgi:hypothetical protein
MSRYRKIEVKTWTDDKFRRLSPIPPCGQGLWFFLLTGPHTGPIPGLFRAGRLGMSEELGWSVEDFDKAFAEVFMQGMVKADFKARLVWLPKAIEHNRPESPNVVRSWRAEFDLLPECAMKFEALESMKASVYALGEGFGKAFGEVFGKALEKTMPNQEQEQERAVEKEREKTSDKLTTPAPTADDPEPDSAAPRRSSAVELKTWIDSLGDDDAIPATDPIFDYAEKAGILREWLELSWMRFFEDMAEKRTKKRDWRAHYRNAVKGNWYRIWWFKDGQSGLTTIGEQARRAAA